MENSGIVVRNMDERSKAAPSRIVLGRSEATGQYVMRPVSKGGKTTLREVRKVIRNIAAEKAK